MGDLKKVLVVDDSLIAAKTLIDIIKELGYDVVGHAKNGAEAMKMYQIYKPDIVTMDIVMPVMDGLQAIRAITKINKDARIAVVSSVGGVASKTEAALKAGASTVICKPFQKEAIISQLGELAA